MKVINTYQLSKIERQELQKILLNIYCDVAEVCKKYKLRIMMGGGSCLGAVRHKGFIPWDDDIDLLMPRDDYNKLLAVFEKELGEKYCLVDMLTTKMGQHTFAKIMKKNTTFLEPCTNLNTSPAGIFVDLFPLEYLPEKYLNRSIFLFFANIFTKLINTIIGYQLCSTPHKIIGWSTSFMSVYKWVILYTSFISACRGSKFFFLPSGGHGVYAEILPADTFFPLSIGYFEGIKVNLPRNPDLYLKNLYGNYMKLPPMDKRQGEHPVIKFSTIYSEKDLIEIEIDETEIINNQISIENTLHTIVHM